MPNVINISHGANTAVFRTEGLNLYLTDIRKYSVLDRDEEYRLLRKYADTDDAELKIEIRNKLLSANQRFIIAAAKQYANNKVEQLLELIGEANVGFIEAIESFNFEKAPRGIRLCSWASFHIKRAINQYLHNYSSLIRQSNTAQIYHKIAKIKSILTQKLEREPSDEEVLEYFMEDEKMTVKDIRDVMKMQINSVDETFQDDEDSYSKNEIDFNNSTFSSNSAEYTVEQEYNKQLIKRAMTVLSDRDKEIITLLYGLGGENVFPMSTDAVAERFNFTSERIRQIHVAALKKMASKLRISSRTI